MPKKAGHRPIPLPGQAIAILITVLAVSIPMWLSMVSAQRRTVAEGLVQRVDALLAGLSSSAANNLNPNLESVRQLIAMRDQVAARMAEARYFTLTGYGLDDPGTFDYLWVSSDPGISLKTARRQFAAENYGRVRLEDEIAAEVHQLAAEVNAAARARVAGMAEEADRLGAEAVKLIRTGTASPVSLKQLDADIFDLNERIFFELQDIRGKVRSVPPLDPRRPPRNLASSYLFYLPVVYRQRGEDVYFRGSVRLAVSTERVRAELARSQRRLLIQAAITALAATGSGLAVILVMAGIRAAAPAGGPRKGRRLTVSPAGGRRERKE